MNAVSFRDIPGVWDNPILEGTRLTDICEGLRKLRSTAVHRNALPIEYLDLAMKLPELFGDNERAAELHRLYGLVNNYPSIDDEEKEGLELLLYDRPVVVAYELFDKVQGLLESTCFQYEQSNDLGWLARNGWEAPEQIESTKWEEHWDIASCAKIEMIFEQLMPGWSSVMP